MANDRRLLDLVVKAFEHFSDDDVMRGAMDPCTKLIVTIEVVRGADGVIQRYNHRIVRQKGADLISPDPVTPADWDLIFSLAEFSTNPSSRFYNGLHSILEQAMKSVSNKAPYKACMRKGSLINDVFERHKLPFRLVNQSNEYYVHRIL